MKLASTELKVLTYLATQESASAAEAASALGLKASQLSRTIAGLSSKGLVHSQRRGKSKSLRLADTRHAALFRSASLQLSHMKLPSLLSGASLEVLSLLCYIQPRSRREIAHRSAVSEAWVARILASLRQVGIVMKADSRYSISPRFQILADFVTEFRRYLNQKIARSSAADAVIVWERNKEFMMETSTGREQKNLRLTGPSTFGRFGIPLLMPSSYYYYSPAARRITLEDAIIHTLLIPRSERTMLVTLLVMKKNEKRLAMQSLVDKARDYGVAGTIEAMAIYLNSKGGERAEGLPPWKEFESRAEEYGVRL